MKEILQGDLMFTNSSKKKTPYKDPTGKQEAMISFQPNTIVYMVPENTPFGKKIARSKLGIIFESNALKLVCVSDK